MKIALVGSAPSSIRLAPYSDPSWTVWGCSPAVYPQAPRVNEWFELHRWEPPVIGKAEQQVAWFSPEYCMWMARHPCVWMQEPVPEIPNSKRLPAEELVRKYGSYFFTSSLSWMFAMAIERILEARSARRIAEQIDAAAVNGEAREPDCIGLWGVDMAATEEYGYQRAGCQFFAQIAQQLNIEVVVPHESDLLLPPPLYGIVEADPMHIKLVARRNELQGKLEAERQMLAAHQHNVSFLQGALDDLAYMMGTWIQLDKGGAKFAEIFNQPPLMAVDTKTGKVTYLDEEAYIDEKVYKEINKYGIFQPPPATDEILPGPVMYGGESGGSMNHDIPHPGKVMYLDEVGKNPDDGKYPGMDIRKT